MSAFDYPVKSRSLSSIREEPSVTSESDSATESVLTEDYDSSSGEMMIPSHVEVTNESSPRPRNSLLTKIRKVLDSLRMKYTQISPCPGSVVLHLRVSCKNGNYKIIIETKESQRRALVFVVSRMRVPDEERLVASEYLMRVNYGLAFGNFEMDFSDGEVRFRHGVDLHDRANDICSRYDADGGHGSLSSWS